MSPLLRNSLVPQASSFWATSGKPMGPCVVASAGRRRRNPGTEIELTDERMAFKREGKAQ